MTFLFLGYVYSVDKSNGDDVLIYKIGDYANFTEVDNFIYENSTLEPTSPPTQSMEPKNSNSSNNNNVIIGTVIGSVLGIIFLGFIGFIVFRRYKKSHPVMQIA